MQNITDFDGFIHQPTRREGMQLASGQPSIPGLPPIKRKAPDTLFHPSAKRKPGAITSQSKGKAKASSPDDHVDVPKASRQGFLGLNASGPSKALHRPNRRDKKRSIGAILDHMDEQGTSGEEGTLPERMDNVILGQASKGKGGNSQGPAKHPSSGKAKSPFLRGGTRSEWDGTDDVED